MHFYRLVREKVTSFNGLARRAQIPIPHCQTSTLVLFSFASYDQNLKRWRSELTQLEGEDLSDLGIFLSEIYY